MPVCPSLRSIRPSLLPQAAALMLVAAACRAPSGATTEAMRGATARETTPLNRYGDAAVELPWRAETASHDYSAIDPLVRDARVVMLGEPWHGDGAAIARRIELVRYLHERHDFDVLVMEADFYAIHQAWEGARRTGDVAEVAAQVYPFWTETQAARPLWAYVRQQMQRGDTLHVAGVDTKLVGPRSRTELRDSLAVGFATLAGVSATSAREASSVLAAALSPAPSAAEQALLTRERFARLTELGDALARATAQHVATASDRVSAYDRFWAQATANVGRNLHGERRDTGMGANFLWLATQQYPQRKLILWAHNNHLVADKWMLLDAPDSIPGVPRSDGARAATTYLGDEVRRAFGNRVVAIATTVYEGQYSPDIEAALGPLGGAPRYDFNRVAPVPPAPPGTLEAHLAGAGFRTALVDLRRLQGAAAVPTRVLDYHVLPPVTLALWKGFDGLLFLRRTAGLNDSVVP